MSTEKHTRKLNPTEAADHLHSKHGIKREESTLAKLRSVGGGPAFYKAGRQIFYSEPALDEWAEKLLGRELRSTSEYTAAA